MGQHLLASAVSGFLLAFVAQLQREGAAPQRDGGQNAGGWRAPWLPQLAAALGGGSESHRDHLASHLLPALLALDPPALGLLLGQLLPHRGGGGGEGAAAGSLAVLKAARKQQLLTDLDALPQAGLGAAAVRAALLAAVRSSSEGLRCGGGGPGEPVGSLDACAVPLLRLDWPLHATLSIPCSCPSYHRADALTMVCAHPKTSAMPTAVELEVMAEAVSLTLRCSSSSLKHKTLAPLGRMMLRMRSAVAAALHRRARPPAVVAAVAAQCAWLHWFGRTLLASLYPGGCACVWSRATAGLGSLHGPPTQTSPAKTSAPRVCPPPRLGRRRQPRAQLHGAGAAGPAAGGVWGPAQPGACEHGEGAGVLQEGDAAQPPAV